MIGNARLMWSTTFLFWRAYGRSADFFRCVEFSSPPAGAAPHIAPQTARNGVVTPHLAAMRLFAAALLALLATLACAQTTDDFGATAATLMAAEQSTVTPDASLNATQFDSFYHRFLGGEPEHVRVGLTYR